MNVEKWLSPHEKLNGLAPIDHLFNRLDGLYPSRWRASFSSPQSINNWREAWADGLAEEGITGLELKNGIRECRRRFDWPPSLAEFIKSCRPDICIDFELSFTEAVTQMQNRKDGKDKWSHPAIYWAAIKIGQFDIRTATWGSIKNRWISALKAEINKNEWPDIPPHRESLPPPGKCSISIEESRRRIAVIHNDLLAKMRIMEMEGENAES